MDWREAYPHEQQYMDLCFLGKPEIEALAACWWPPRFASQKQQVSKVLSCSFQYMDSWRADNIEYIYFRRTHIIIVQASYSKHLSPSVIYSSASISSEREEDTSWSSLTILCTWKTSYLISNGSTAKGLWLSLTCHYSLLSKLVFHLLLSHILECEQFW